MWEHNFSGNTRPQSSQLAEPLWTDPRNSSGNSRPHSSQLAEPLWTDPGLKNEISVRKLISTSKNKQKKRTRGMNG